MKFSRGFPTMLLLLFAGCAAPAGRLTFPTHALETSDRGWFFDTHNRGRADFALLRDSNGRLETLAYDDAGASQFSGLGGRARFRMITAIFRLPIKSCSTA